MARSVRIETRPGGRDVYHLTDSDAGTSAQILPSVGFNLFDLRLPRSGRIAPVIAAEPNWADRPEHPTRNGMPLLFPFPNRIRDACFDFEGRDFRLPANKPPHAIHGFASDAAFDVLESGVDQAGAFVAGAFVMSKNAPHHARSWPGDAALKVRYSLAGARLQMVASITNQGAAAMPWGFGVHCYVRLDSPADLLRIPAESYWELSEALPTGRVLPTTGRLDFRHGRPIEAPLDDVLTGLRPDASGIVECGIGPALAMRLGAGFREIVVFTPPWFAGAVAVEPYTQATDAIHLQGQGIDAGLRILEPGQSAGLCLELAAVA